jgi:hypothetical protein
MLPPLEIGQSQRAGKRVMIPDTGCFISDAQSSAFVSAGRIFMSAIGTEENTKAPAANFQFMKWFREI